MKAGLLKHKAKTNYSLAKESLKRLQKLPLMQKIALTERRIKEYYDFYNGQVCVSFSGGKDSTVLLNIVRSMYPDVVAVFADTGLEYPEIRDFVKSVDNVEWVTPKKPFTQVIKEYGYPVVGKRQARYIRDLQNATEKNKATCNLRLTGYNKKGKYCPSMKLAEKWKRLIKAPFKISDQCCDILKKQPMKKYQKKTGKRPIAGSMAKESGLRERMYLMYGCNTFSKNAMSLPLSMWTDKDVWEYINKYNIPYSKIYDMGEDRTGCMFCLFGLHLEKKPNRFERMKNSHPKQYKYCMDKLGLRKVIEYINKGGK